MLYPDDLHGCGKSEPDRDIVHGRFVELVPFEQIVEDVQFVGPDPSYAGTMRVTTILSPVAGGTKVVISCENVPVGIKEADHAEGLASTLKNLALFIE